MTLTTSEYEWQKYTDFLFKLISLLYRCTRIRVGNMTLEIKKS
jgi:hypothetical protein